MRKYKTIMKDGQVEQIIEKSRFIGYVRPVESKEDADKFIEEIKLKHKNATHNVPAYVIGDSFQLQWASDDGEPQGTSGAPIVQMLVKEGITNVVMVITRYFGGVKLGTGGLVRAYTGTAKLALEEGEICNVKEVDVVSIQVDYTYHGKLQNLAENGEFQVISTIYEDKVTMEISAEPEKSQAVLTGITNLTGGNARVLSQRKELRKEADNG